MHDKVIRDILRRLRRLERRSLHLRRGTVDSTSPLSISVGGSDTAFDDVRPAGASELLVGGPADVIVSGHHVIALPGAGGGTHFGDRLAGAVASLATGGTNRADYTHCAILCQTTLTGIRYRVGSTSSGNVRVGLYDAAGTRVANRTTDVAQAAANQIQSVAFDTTVTVNPGMYFMAVIFSSATATRFVVNGLVPSIAAQTEASFAMPASITPPTAQGATHTLLSTY